MFSTENHVYHRIWKRRNEVSFGNEYYFLVHNKTFLKKINMQKFCDEIWYIVYYLFVNIFSFLNVFD